MAGYEIVCRPGSPSFYHQQWEAEKEVREHPDYYEGCIAKQDVDTSTQYWYIVRPK